MAAMFNNPMAAALCIQYIQRHMPPYPAALSTVAATRNVNSTDHKDNSGFAAPVGLPPHPYTHFQQHLVANHLRNVNVIPVPNANALISSSCTVSPVKESCVITDTTVENVAVPSFNVNGEPRLFLPQFIIMVQEKGVTMEKLNDKCEELRIQCIQATKSQVEAAKKQQVVASEVKSLGLIFKSDAERLCKQLFHSHPSTFKDANVSSSIYVYHNGFGKERGILYPDLYTSDNAKCIECDYCKGMLSPKAFVGHTHKSREVSVKHWGFDSSNWRYYLILDKQKYARFDDREFARMKQNYENVKAKFLDKKPQQFPEDLIEIPPPPAHMNTGDKRKVVVDMSRNSPPVLANPERAVPKPGDDQYDELHVPNVSLAPVNKRLKISDRGSGPSAFHPFNGFDVGSNGKRKVPTLAGCGPSGIEALDRDFNEEWELTRDLSDGKVLTRADQQKCLDRFTIVKNRYLNSIRALSEALNKANDTSEPREHHDDELVRKLERIRQKKRALKRVLNDHHEPHRKQYLQLRYQLETEQQDNADLKEQLSALQTSSSERIAELEARLQEKTEEASNATLEADELRERLRRLQRLQSAVSSLHQAANSSNSMMATVNPNHNSDSSRCSSVMSPRLTLAVPLSPEHTASTSGSATASATSSAVGSPLGAGFYSSSPILTKLEDEVHVKTEVDSNVDDEDGPPEIELVSP